MSTIPRRAAVVGLALGALAPLGVVPSARAQAVPAGRVRGTIAAVTADRLTVIDTRGQSVALAMSAGTPLIAIAPARIEDIKPGSYIGTAALPQPDGTLMAMEIQVFPEAMRGVGEGHRAWDLQPDSTMTNGTVGEVVGTSGRKLTLTYKGGQKTVTVPPAAPIITYEPATPAMLAVGAHVIVFVSKTADGTLRADRIGIGKDGLVPPM